MNRSRDDEHRQTFFRELEGRGPEPEIYGPATARLRAILRADFNHYRCSSMATAKKKSTKKSAKKTTSNKVGWAEAMRNALANKQPAGGFPDQGKPRSTAVKKVRKNAF